jgi:acyl-CoA reductase-like NAD-dependent aldehyde dehydrogenase
VSTLNEQQIDTLAQQVLQYLNADSTSGETDQEDKDLILGKGVFPDMNSAVSAAAKAYQNLNTITLAKRNEIISSIREKMKEHGQELAELAHSETGLGRVEDKIQKNKLVTEKTPGIEILTPGAFSGDRGLTLIEPAPYGVIGAITPSTNPTSTIICNTIGMLAAGNAVVFNVHPAAKKVSNRNVHLLNEAIIAAGGPENLVTTLANPTIASAQELMQNPGIRLLVVTGGGAVVREAMASGKRAICAGPGNPPVVVDESADIANAAEYIVRGASMDNNIICVDEKEVFVVDKVYNQLLSEFRRHHAMVLSPEQVKQIENVIFTEIKGPGKPAVVEKSLIGKNVRVILEKMGISANDKLRLAIAPVPEDHPLVWTEQMLPVLPVVSMPNADAAIDIAKRAEHGFGHTATMHSRNIDNLSRMAREINCSIFVKNGPTVAGLGFGGEGYCSFSIASPTGEGLTNARSFSRERRCVLVDHFRIV